VDIANSKSLCHSNANAIDNYTGQKAKRARPDGSNHTIPKKRKKEELAAVIKVANWGVSSTGRRKSSAGRSGMDIQSPVMPQRKTIQATSSVGTPNPREEITKKWGVDSRTAPGAVPVSANPETNPRTNANLSIPTSVPKGTPSVAPKPATDIAPSVTETPGRIPEATNHDTNPSRGLIKLKITPAANAGINFGLTEPPLPAASHQEVGVGVDDGIRNRLIYCRKNRDLALRSLKESTDHYHQACIEYDNAILTFLGL